MCNPFWSSDWFIQNWIIFKNLRSFCLKMCEIFEKNSRIVENFFVKKLLTRQKWSFYVFWKYRTNGSFSKTIVFYKNKTIVFRKKRNENESFSIVSESDYQTNMYVFSMSKWLRWILKNGLGRFSLPSWGSTLWL